MNAKKIYDYKGEEIDNLKTLYHLKEVHISEVIK